ncbi:MAG: tyrosine-type recombinase/integrase, partial [Planctomycetota bacterium]
LIINPISTFLSQGLYEYKKSNETDGCLFDDRIVDLSLISKYSTHFSRLFKSLGIKDFTYHSLRHCCSTFHSDTGADAFTTQALLGHSSLVETALYTNKQSEAKRKAVETMTEHVLNIGQKTKITSFTGNKGTT